MPLISLLLVGTGLLVLYSAAPGNEFSRQVMFVAAGVVLIAMLVWVGKNRILASAPYLYAGSIFLLVLTRFIGTEVNGAKSWLYIHPSLPGIQPSEISKIALLLMIANMLHERPLKSLRDYARIALVVLPVFGLVLTESDLGSSIVIAALTVGMMLVRGIPWKLVVAAAVLIVGLVPTVIYPNLQPYQQLRIISFINPEADPQGSGYQVIQSTIAIGSGGLAGKGYMQGTQSQLGFIPFRQTDFIFAVLAEETGFLGALGVLVLFSLLFWRLTVMAQEAVHERDQLVIMGVNILIAFQVVVNIAVTLGLAPVTGITLPLFSAGGTSLVSTMVALALAFIVHRERFTEW